MAALLKWARNLTRPPLRPLRFPSAGFELVPTDHILEEEQFDEFKAGQYFPVRIGDVYDSKYQVLGKLGFGTTSTVWLARNLQDHGHVALKVYTRDAPHSREVETYRSVSRANPSHPGFRHVRKALGSFVLHYPRGDHTCLVLEPLWDSWKDLARRNPANRFTEPLLKAGLREVFLALDYLHTECRFCATDIKADNILQEIRDKGILHAFTQAELEQPSPRKFVDGRPIYLSRRFNLPKKFGEVVLSDFGAAVRGDQKRNHDAQPNVYHSPEVMLKVDWSYPVDIWNIGVMSANPRRPALHQIWDVFEGRHLFYGDDPNGKGYSTRAHLAEVIGMLGPPPIDLLQRGVRSKEFFTEDGQWTADIPIPENTSLEAAEAHLEGENKAAFLSFVRGMLQWRLEDRKTAKELLQDPWLNSK
ncbi:uncharacterized protein THITE_2050733 [Thermothielavioides terrestris NRRL 8126]|uniref:non-specific serine/threonine protein kinase n=1 Tax=Thermothielavioides terrestris (strain ATCC 38088 / NRRL 8126) TaxID=578455 RepID=G2R7X8_THETT|nr:uncharacterized protein THITE_2050733 [Thermothielavioides terrestris NRRL 8126]AEO68037.1 hypothetical protein THITE_2050733 [Thermothielavioides terrestris NRRL 8126]